MRAEFFKPDEAARIVGTADWDGAGLHIEAKDDEARLALSRVGKRTDVHREPIRRLFRRFLGWRGRLGSVWVRKPRYRIGLSIGS